MQQREQQKPSEEESAREWEVIKQVFVEVMSKYFRGETFDRAFTVFCKFDRQYSWSIISLFKHAIFLPAKNGEQAKRRDAVRAVNIIEKVLETLEEFGNKPKTYLPHKHSGGEFHPDEVAKMISDIYRFVLHEIPTVAMD